MGGGGAKSDLQYCVPADARRRSAPQRERGEPLSRLWEGDVFRDPDADDFLFKLPLFAPPGVGCMWTLAVYAKKLLHVTVLGRVVVLGAFCTGKSAAAGVCAVPKLLPLETALRVPDVRPDWTSDETCVDKSGRANLSKVKIRGFGGICLSSLRMALLCPDHKGPPASRFQFRQVDHHRRPRPGSSDGNVCGFCPSSLNA